MPFPLEIRLAVRKEQRQQCSFCGVQYDPLEVHHKTPASQGGGGGRDNAVGLCPGCHDMFDREQEVGGLTYERVLQKLGPYADYVNSE